MKLTDSLFDLPAKGTVSYHGNQLNTLLNIIRRQLTQVFQVICKFFQVHSSIQCKALVTHFHWILRLDRSALLDDRSGVGLSGVGWGVKILPLSRVQSLILHWPQRQVSSSINKSTICLMLASLHINMWIWSSILELPTASFGPELWFRKYLAVLKAKH